MNEFIAALLQSSFGLHCSAAVLALLAERLFPIPEQFHPLTFARLLARNMARKTCPSSQSAVMQHYISGTLSYLVLFAPMLLVLYLLLALAEVTFFFDVFLLYLAISFTAELKHYEKIKRALRAEKKMLAKEWLKRLVKRDTAPLSPIGIAKAAMESLILRFVYQVVTPIFVFIAVGPIFAIAYRLALVCYWEWKKPFTGQHAFSRPAAFLCKGIQFIPGLVTWLLALILLLPRNTKGQHREHVAVTSTEVDKGGMSVLLLQVFAKRLGFALGGPLQYADVFQRFPRYGKPYQVKLDDMSAVRQGLTALHFVIGLGLISCAAIATLQ